MVRVTSTRTCPALCPEAGARASAAACCAPQTRPALVAPRACLDGLLGAAAAPAVCHAATP